MNALELAIAELVETLRDPNWIGADVEDCLHAMSEATASAAASARDEAVIELAGHIRAGDIQQAAFCALCAGTLVEHGAAARPLFDALCERLPDVLEHAQRFVRRAKEAHPFDEDQELGDDDLEVEDRVVPRSYLRELGREDPAAVQAFSRLGEWFLPLIATLARNPSWIPAASGLVLAPAEALAGSSGDAEFAVTMLRVLLDEALVVLLPHTRQGFQVRMSKVETNHQLHILLADLLIGSQGVSGQRPSRSAVASVTTHEHRPVWTKSAFGTYTWQAAGLDLSRDAIDLDLEVWAEGVPADIPTHEGTRVLLLGPVRIQRSWNFPKVFAELPPELELLERYSPAEVDAWIQRLARSRKTRGRRR